MMMSATAWELIIMLMVICIKEDGKITKDMEKESTNVLQLDSKFVFQLLVVKK